MGVLAVFLLVVSVAAGLNYFGPKATLGRQQAAVAGSTEVIRKALWAFAARNYRLPCPADGQTNTGIEAPVGGGTCTYSSNLGVVPWKTLGIQETDALDGWGRLIGYAVSPSLVTGSPFATPAESSNDLIQVSVNGVTSATKYAYLLISFGADGAGGWLQSGNQLSTATITTTREYANTLSNAFSGATAFVSWPSNTQTGSASYYDDYLTYETSAQICTDLNGAQAGALNSPYCTTSNTNNDNGACGSGTSGCSPLNLNANSGFGSISATGSSGGSTGNATTGASIITPAGSSDPVLFLGAANSDASGATLANDSQSCAWLNAPLPWTNSTLRAYFEFATSYQGQLGDGFTFTMLPAGTSLTAGAPCGVTPSAATVQGSYLGFEGIADGVQATATAGILAGVLTGITMQQTGSGYLYVPPVTLTGGLSLGNAATAAVSAMSVSNATVTDIGFSYGFGMAAAADPRPSVTVATAASTGCTSNCTNASVTVNSMSVTEVTLTGGGSGYELPSVVITPAAGDPGSGATATATVSFGAVGAIAVTNGGSGYATAPAVSIIGNGTNASATATLDGNGHVASITVVSGGSGYGPAITVTSASDPTAINATLTASVDSAGSISALEINSVGSGYTHIPSIAISGGLSPASASVTGMSVTGLNVASAGSGYVTVPAITIAAPPAGCVTCTTATAAAGMSITGIALTLNGGVYITGPTVTIPPPKVLPKMALEFDTYFYEDDPDYDNYGYIDGITPPPAASYTIQDLTDIRHDPNYEHVAVDLVDTLYHDDSYHYSTNATDNTGYTVGSSCDNPGPGGVSSGPHGGYATGGEAGGCTYSTSAFPGIVTDNGPLSGTQGNTTIYYHPMRVEAQRYCDSTCSSCGNTGNSADTYVLVRAYLDCSSAALGGASCSDMTQNLLIGNIPGSTSSPNSPLPSAYSSASTVNFCTPDPGTLSPLGVGALDNVLVGFSAGAGSVNGGVMIRNLSVGTF